MADLRIFSYLPNPRLYKATIAARFSGAEIEIIGAKPKELADWLWDYDARPIADGEADSLAEFAITPRAGFNRTLYKTPAFNRAHPFGAVPAGFAADGEVGIFESNSIARAAARLGPNGGALMGQGPLEQSRIDSFLDRALVFARDMQRYMLAAEALTPADRDEMENSLHGFAGGVERALTHGPYLTGNALTLADIVSTCDLCQMSNELRMTDHLDKIGVQPVVHCLAEYPALSAYLTRLSGDERFSADLAPYFEKLAPILGRAEAA